MQQQQRADRPRRRSAISGPSGSWPENSTSDAPWSVASAKPTASPPISEAQHGHEQHHAPLDARADGEREQLDRAAEERRDQAERDRPAEHRRVGSLERRQSGIGQRERPEAGERVEADEDQRADARGQQARVRSTTPSIGPPRPDASSSRNAPRSGEPSSELMAAKLPAAAITVVAVGGASRAARRTASTPRPLPIRISGASGPRTDAEAQRRQGGEQDPGQLRSAGSAPAGLEAVGRRVPAGSRQTLIANATSSPDSASSGSGHHAGGESNPRPSGRSSNSASCSDATSLRKP